MSQARHAAEAQQAYDVSVYMLQLTDEGRNILARFAKSIGCDFEQMQAYEQESPGHIVQWIDENHSKIGCFLVAIIFTFNLK